MSTASYPIVKIPARITEISRSLPVPPDKPVLPKHPDEPTLPSLKSPNDSNSGVGCLLVPVVLFGIALIIQGNSRKSESDFVVTIGVGILICALWGWIKIKNQAAIDKAKVLAEAEATYRKKLLIYQNELSIYNTYNRQAVEREHEITNKEYEQKLQQYKVDVLNSSFLFNYRTPILNSYLKSIKKPQPYTGQSYRKGVSEDFFIVTLKLCFADDAPADTKKQTTKILTNYVLPFDNSSRPFMPDIIITLYGLEFVLVIEIDEPYVGSSGQPIHYINSRDYKRDKFFTDNGWIVIRFTEFQIITQPDKCASFIKQTIIGIVGSSYKAGSITAFSYDINNDKIRASNLIVSPQWTEQEAHAMAFKRYRNSYLPPILSNKIIEEQYINEDLSGFKHNSTDSFDDDNDLPF
ncbi:hypothetical protein E4631_25430 [Hymenobacter sp. UV11]|uniref:hypothetical protein n=1 Tax=Hymenobacter sp. UV11 TaxID=1849735 RepID=UPI0010616487|nr:hypothetical protein [Hymenobacter sp. UV11]TFZ62233.1 hypothetical protein E4631_25430 [Hymenobacter sp. UV11]